MLSQQRKTHGFTLVEILTVLAIIVILMGISFPVFRTVQEKGNQSSCLTKLQQIALGVKQYKLDEGVYPGNLEDIGGYISLRTDTTSGKATGGKDLLICPDDENTKDTTFTTSYSGLLPKSQSYPYSSYFDTSGTGVVWNYFGYKSDGFAYTPSTSIYHQYITTGSGTLPSGIQAWRQYPCLENRFAPDYTIITHCVHHRPKTQKKVKESDRILYNNMVDTVVRLSGTAKAIPRTQTYNSAGTTLTKDEFDWVSQPD